MAQDAAASLLSRYRTMRDFERTPEPRGGRPARRPRPRAAKAKLRFVVQRHRASHLHYDFRLEAAGVLMSWAVPKGPTMRPGERRLAMQTEDHPLDYYDFEGTIPEGSYGAGDVIVWDWGDYELASGSDPYADMKRGKISFVLHGNKLRGRFTLVKMRGRGGKDNTWLLLKADDDEADRAWDLDAHERSVKSGKTNDEVVADASGATWHSDRPATRKRSAKAPGRRDPMPAEIHPELATLVDAPFDDDDWLFEIKWDGFRAVCAADARGKVTLTSRNGKDLLARFPGLAGVGAAFREVPIVVDGEIVSLDARGQSSFQRLQGSPGGLTFVAFDAIYARGRDLRGEPLEERKRILEELLLPDAKDVLYSKHVLGAGKKLFALAKAQGLEGIVAKRRASLYVERRTRDWLKIKVTLTQDCVVGGYTDPKGSRKGFGSLLLGVAPAGRASRGAPLEYAGDVGTGFSQATLEALHRRMQKLESDRCPFSTTPPGVKHSHWLRPELVAAVRFTEWTRDGKLRHPAFEGLRDDKSPAQCVRERPVKAKERGE